MRRNAETVAANVNEDRNFNDRVNIADLFLPAFQSWPVYDGHNMPVVKFVRKLNEKATAASYDEEKLARLLPLQLSGAAKVKYTSCPDEIELSYRRTVDQLRSDFRNRNYVEISRSKSS